MYTTTEYEELGQTTLAETWRELINSRMKIKVF